MAFITSLASLNFFKLKRTLVRPTVLKEINATWKDILVFNWNRGKRVPGYSEDRLSGRWPAALPFLYRTGRWDPLWWKSPTPGRGPTHSLQSGESYVLRGIQEGSSSVRVIQLRLLPNFSHWSRNSQYGEEKRLISEIFPESPVHAFYCSSGPKLSFVFHSIYIKTSKTLWPHTPFPGRITSI